MPEIVFKGKEYVYNHHLTVPYLLSLEAPAPTAQAKAWLQRLVDEGVIEK